MRLRLQWEFPCLAHPGQSGDRHFCTILSEWPWTRGSVPQFLHMPKDTIYEMPVCSGDLEEPSANVTFLSLSIWRGSTDDATLLPFKKGDLLILTKKQGPSASENWIPGQNDRTGKTGLVPVACLYIIPSLTKPSAQLLVCHM